MTNIEKPIRVLHVLSSLNIGSGIANVVMNYFRSIDRTKILFDALVFYEAEKSFTEEFKQLGGRVFIIAKPSAKDCFKYYSLIDHFFSDNKNEWKAIHLHEILIQKPIFKAAKKSGIRIKIAHAHNVKLSNKPIKALRNKILISGICKSSNVLVGCSELALIKTFGKKAASRGMVLKNGINLDNYRFAIPERQRIRKELCLNDNFVVGNIGRLCIEKNQNFLLDIFSKIIEKKANSILLLVGDGEHSALIKKASRLQILDKIIFLGNRTDIPLLLCSMDVFVFPSIFEGLGVALIEAQAMGLKCFSSEKVPHEAKVSDNVAFLSLDDSAEMWASSILSSDLTFKNASEDIISHGYDIKDVVVDLEKIYTVEELH